MEKIKLQNMELFLFAGNNKSPDWFRAFLKTLNIHAIKF
jgi:hypothetical protein